MLRNANPRVADPDAYYLSIFCLDPDLFVEYGSEC